MQDEVTAFERECLDGGHTEPTEAGPGVVELRGAVRQPEPGKIESDPTQASSGELSQHLAIQERRGPWMQTTA